MFSSKPKEKARNNLNFTGHLAQVSFYSFSSLKSVLSSLPVHIIYYWKQVGLLLSTNGMYMVYLHGVSNYIRAKLFFLY